MRRAAVAMLLCALAFSAVGALPRPISYDSFTPVGNGILEAFSGDFSLSFWLRTAPGYSDGEAVVLRRHQAGSYDGYIVFLNPS